jgi:hypothetical protein
VPHLPLEALVDVDEAAFVKRGNRHRTWTRAKGGCELLLGSPQLLLDQLPLGDFRLQGRILFRHHAAPPDALVQRALREQMLLDEDENHPQANPGGERDIEEQQVRRVHDRWIGDAGERSDGRDAQQPRGIVELSRGQPEMAATGDAQCH